MGSWAATAASLRRSVTTKTTRTFTDVLMQNCHLSPATWRTSFGDKTPQPTFISTSPSPTWTRRGRGGGARRARRRCGASPDTQFAVSGPKAALVGAILQPAAAEKLPRPGRSASTATAALQTYAGLLDEFDPNFNIVTP